MIESCQRCGGLYSTENMEAFAGTPCRCPEPLKWSPTFGDMNCTATQPKADPIRVECCHGYEISAIIIGEFADIASTNRVASDEQVDEVTRRMDAVVDAAVAWRQSDMPLMGDEGIFEAAEKLESAVDSLLELRSVPEASS